MGSGTDFNLGFKSTANNAAGNENAGALTSNANTPGSSGGGGGGSGVVGPISSVNLDIPYFAGTSGGIIGDSGIKYTSLLTTSSLPLEVTSAGGDLTWALRYFVEDYATLQLCVTAAAANPRAAVFLPPGITALPSTGLVLPNGWTGTLAIFGCGKGVSVLQQSTASAPGINFSLAGPASTTGGLQNAWVNRVLLKDFSVQANAATLTTAISVSYYTAPISPSVSGLVNGGQYVIVTAGTINWTSIGWLSGAVGSIGTYNNAAITGAGGSCLVRMQTAGNNDGCILDNIEAICTSSNGWNTGIVINSAWYAKLSGIYCGNGNLKQAPTSSSTANGGQYGLQFFGCVNCQVRGISTEYWNIGIYQGNDASSIGVSQGTQIWGWEALECMNCLNSYATVYCNQILLDNGNIDVAGKCSVIIQGAGSNGSQIVGGQILQNGGANMVQLNGTSNCKITGIDFEYDANISDALIRIYTGSAYCNITGNTGNNLFCQLDSGSSTNRVQNNVLNGGTNLDNGTSNTVGDVTGINSDFVVPAVPGTVFYFSVPIPAQSCLGKQPSAVMAQCVATPAAIFQVQYDYNAQGGTTTSSTLWLQVTLWSGGSMAAYATNAYQFNAIVTP